MNLGKYLKFLESDDRKRRTFYMSPELLAKMKQEAKEFRFRICQHPYHIEK